jgi:hypothetical protein
MMDVLFFVKTFLLTIAIVLLMQIHVGERSLESHAMSWVQSSAVVAPLNGVAKGAAKMVRDLTQTISISVTRNSKKKKDAKSSSLSQSDKD